MTSAGRQITCRDEALIASFQNATTLSSAADAVAVAAAAAEADDGATRLVTTLQP